MMGNGNIQRSEIPLNASNFLKEHCEMWRRMMKDGEMRCGSRIKAGYTYSDCHESFKGTIQIAWNKVRRCTL